MVLRVATLAFAGAVGLTCFGLTLVLPRMQAGLGLSSGQMAGPVAGGLGADHFGSFSPTLLLAAGGDTLGLLGTVVMRLGHHHPRRA